MRVRSALPLLAISPWAKSTPSTTPSPTSPRSCASSRTTGGSRGSRARSTRPSARSTGRTAWPSTSQLHLRPADRGPLPGLERTGCSRLDPGHRADRPAGGEPLRGVTCTGGEATSRRAKIAEAGGANLTHKPPGTFLAGADLHGANLQESVRSRGGNADLTGANLTGAALRPGAKTNRVTWSNTTCPDGTKPPTAHGGTCHGHLTNGPPGPPGPEPPNAPTGPRRYGRGPVRSSMRAKKRMNVIATRPRSAPIVA